MDCSLTGCSVHGIFQARILEWVAMPSFKGSSWPRIEPTSLMSPTLAGGFFTTSTTWEVPTNLLQCHNSKTSILWCSAFFMVQLLHSYMTTRKTIALTTLTFVGRVISLLFNTLSRFTIAFLPRSKYLLISWLQSPSAVILEPKKIKSITASTLSTSIGHEVMGQDAMIFF